GLDAHGMPSARDARARRKLKRARIACDHPRVHGRDDPIAPARFRAYAHTRTKNQGAAVPMVFWLTSRPGWVLILFLFLFTALAMAGPFLVRLRIRLQHLRGNNEVAGFKFAVIGVLYAVLLAFVVIIAWERFHD